MSAVKTCPHLDVSAPGGACGCGHLSSLIHNMRTLSVTGYAVFVTGAINEGGAAASLLHRGVPAACGNFDKEQCACIL
eukprot:1143327-Pelagomonas_calceolata.AAC.9